MSIVTVNKNTYTVEPLYQWDVDQTLEIRGLSLAKVPEIHFAHEGMSRAIVRQSTMDAAGVVTVVVPNSLLQKPYTIHVYVCGYTGSTFETLYKLDVPVKPRACPSDYTLENDSEVYSFDKLENDVANAMHRVDNIMLEVSDECNAVMEQALKTVGYKKDELLAGGTKTAYNLKDDATPDDVFNLIKTRMAELEDRAKDYAMVKGCQSLGPDGGLDGTDLIAVTCEGHVGVTSAEASEGTGDYYKTGTTTATIAIDLSGLADDARVGYVGGFGPACSAAFLTSMGNAGTVSFTVTASVMVNGVEIMGHTFEEQTWNSGISTPVAPDLSVLTMNIAAVLGRPLTNTDALDVTLTTSWSSQYGAAEAHSDVTQDGIFVRYLEV